MKTSLSLLIFTLLTVCGSRSQGTTAGSGNLPDTLDTRPVSFPFWMAKQIALDLSEKSHLERLHALSGKEIAFLNSLVSGLENNLEQKSLQLQLLQDQKAALEVSLEAEKLKKPRDNLLQWFLQMAGALGVGYVIGKL